MWIAYSDSPADRMEVILGEWIGGGQGEEEEVKVEMEGVQVKGL